MQSGNHEPRDIVRWETECCGYLFNTSAPGTIARQDEELVFHIEGQGKFINECPGCGTKTPNVTKLS